MDFADSERNFKMFRERLSGSISETIFFSVSRRNGWDATWTTLFLSRNNIPQNQCLALMLQFPTQLYGQSIKSITRETQFIDLTKKLWFVSQIFGLHAVPDSFPLSVSYMLSLPGSNNSNHIALRGQIFRANTQGPLSRVVIAELSCLAVKVRQTHTEALTKISANS